MNKESSARKGTHTHTHLKGRAQKGNLEGVERACIGLIDKLYYSGKFVFPCLRKLD